MGAALQFALLALFAHVAGLHYLLATAFSVEAVILHNFVWHWRWTWHDRRGTSGCAIAALARFNLSNGLVSLTANLLSAYLLTGVWRIDPVIASLVSTAVASLANFFLSDRFVFASSPMQAETSASQRVCKLPTFTFRSPAKCFRLFSPSTPSTVRSPPVMWASKESGPDLMHQESKTAPP